MTIFLSILVLLSSVSLIGSVMMQESAEQGGMGALTGAGASLWGKSRGKSKEDVLKRITIISAVIFMISTLALAAN